MPPLLALIVDDNRTDRESTARTLTAAGYRTETAVDARAGIAAAANVEPDVIVVDWVMPRMSGLDLMRNVRAKEGGKYPYIVAASETAIDITAAFAGGVDDFLRKPATREELIARVDGCKRLRRLVTKLAARTSAFDWSDGVDLTRLQAWTQLDASIGVDLAAMFGQASRIEKNDNALEGTTIAAEIPMSLSAENLEVRILVSFQEASLRKIAADIVGLDASEEILRDVVREIANLSGGALKRMAQVEGIVLSTGIPVDIDPRAFSAAKPRAVHKWHAVFDAISSFIAFQAEVRERANERVAARDLREGMVLARDVLNPTGALLVPAGTRLNATSITRMVELFGRGWQVDVSNPG